MLTNIYRLDVLVNGKVVQFVMNIDPSLKLVKKVDDDTVCKFRNRLETLAISMFKEEK